MFYEVLCLSSQGLQTLPTPKESYCLKFVFALGTSSLKIMNFIFGNEMTFQMFYLKL